MSSFYFDGNKLRIYEVPTNSSYVVDANGYRIYSPNGVGENIVYFDVQRDLWSRFQDYAQDNSWTQLAFNRTGGGFRGLDELGNPRYQTNDFQLRTSEGWRIVLANYPHEAVFRGNLFKDGSGELFDYARLTVHGVVPRLEGYDSLQSYFIATGGSETIWTLPLRDQVVNQLGKISSLIEPTDTGDRFSAKALEATPVPVVTGGGLTQEEHDWLNSLYRATGAEQGFEMVIYKDANGLPVRRTYGDIDIRLTHTPSTISAMRFVP